MNKINFQNLPNTTTPVNALNLNQLQTNIENDDMVLRYRGEASTDLNNTITFGMYNLRATYTNAPTTDPIYGVLLVYTNKGGTWNSSSAANWITQEITTGTTKYIRYGTYTGWGNWKRVIMEQEVTAGTITNSSNIQSGTIKYAKQLNVVVINIEIILAQSTAGTWQTVELATLDSSLIPLQPPVRSLIKRDSSNYFYTLDIDNNGKLTLKDRGSGNIQGGENIVGSITYISSN